MAKKNTQTLDADFGEVNVAPPEPMAEPLPGPFTAEGLGGLPPIPPRIPPFKVAHKTTADLFAAYPHRPTNLAESMADYLNAQYALGNVCVGSMGDTTNIYFIFVGE